MLYVRLFCSFGTHNQSPAPHFFNVAQKHFTHIPSISCFCQMFNAICGLATTDDVEDEELNIIIRKNLAQSSFQHQRIGIIASVSLSCCLAEQDILRKVRITCLPRFFESRGSPCVQSIFSSAVFFKSCVFYELSLSVACCVFCFHVPLLFFLAPRTVLLPLKRSGVQQQTLFSKACVFHLLPCDLFYELELKGGVGNACR